MGVKVEYEIENELLLSLNWGNQYPIGEISKLFRCGYCTIMRRMKMYGVPRNQLRDMKKGKPNWNSGKTHNDDSRILSGKLHPMHNKDKYIIEPELLKSLYWGNDYSIPDIATIFGCSWNAVSKKMIKYKIPCRDKISARDLKGGRFEKVFIIEPELLWSLHWGNRYNQTTISNFFKCSSGCIHLHMKEYKIPIINNKEMIREQIKNGLLPTGHFGEIHRSDRTIYRWIESIWRKLVYNKDNYTCKICGDRGGCGHRVKLNAHHILPYAKYPNVRYDISNGITLCEKCHRMLHSFNRIVPNIMYINDYL